MEAPELSVFPWPTLNAPLYEEIAMEQIHQMSDAESTMHRDDSHAHRFTPRSLWPTAQQNHFLSPYLLSPLSYAKHATNELLVLCNITYHKSTLNPILSYFFATSLLCRLPCPATVPIGIG